MGSPCGCPHQGFPQECLGWECCTFGSSPHPGHHILHPPCPLETLVIPWDKRELFYQPANPREKALLNPSECKTFPHIWSLEVWIVIPGNWCLLLQWLCRLGNKALLVLRRRFLLSLEMFATSLASCALLGNKRKLYQASKLWYFLVLPFFLFPSKIWVPVCPGNKICKGNIFGEELYSEYGKVKFQEWRDLPQAP